MNTFFNHITCLCLLIVCTTAAYSNGISSDTSRAYAVPTLTRTPSGDVALSWTEKDNDGIVYFYWAKSGDQGKTFGDKKLIHSAAGIGNSRLMRPKLLFRKDGSAVAVFALRGPQTANPQTVATAALAPPQEAAHAGHDAHGAGHEGHKAEAPKATRPGGGRPTDLQIVYVVSTDQGNTWTQPTPVHADKTPNIVRGFFDATVLANGEIGVAYLNDIQGKAHQRDLRFVTSTGGKFSDERILDPFVCDCCNISLLVDPAGALHLYYRENQDNIRDIAQMSSTDNGRTFSKPQILSKDNWQINGCPHSGPTSSAGGGSPLVAWFSGTQDSPGIRVVNEQGKRLFVLDDPTAKNAYLVPAPKSSVLLWEQSQPSESGMSSVIAFRNINGAATPNTQFVKNAQNGTNASGLVLDRQLVVAYEVRKPNNKNSIEWATVSL
ncbi:sialidase family protein [Spirosoma arcticum]